MVPLQELELTEMVLEELMGDTMYSLSLSLLSCASGDRDRSTRSVRSADITGGFAAAAAFALSAFSAVTCRRGRGMRGSSPLHPRTCHSVFNLHPIPEGPSSISNANTNPTNGAFFQNFTKLPPDSTKWLRPHAHETPAVATHTLNCAENAIGCGRQQAGPAPRTLGRWRPPSACGGGNAAAAARFFGELNGVTPSFAPPQQVSHIDGTIINHSPGSITKARSHWNAPPCCSMSCLSRTKQEGHAQPSKLLSQAMYRRSLVVQAAGSEAMVALKVSTLDVTALESPQSHFLIQNHKSQIYFGCSRAWPPPGEPAIAAITKRIQKPWLTVKNQKIHSPEVAGPRPHLDNTLLVRRYSGSGSAC